GAITVTPTAGDPEHVSIEVSEDGAPGVAVVSGQASSELAVPAVGGSATISIVVNAAGGESKTYEIVLSQQEAAMVSMPSKDATLSALVPSSGALIPVFQPSRLNYTLRVPNGTASVALTPTATAAVASIQINGVRVTSGRASDL